MCNTLCIQYNRNTPNSSRSEESCLFTSEAVTHNGAFALPLYKHLSADPRNRFCMCCAKSCSVIHPWRGAEIKDPPSICLCLLNAHTASAIRLSTTAKRGGCEPQSQWCTSTHTWQMEWEQGDRIQLNNYNSGDASPANKSSFSCYCICMNLEIPLK